MAAFGQVNEYDDKLESWTQYSERLTQYFLANDVVNAEKKRAIFLTVIGPSTYGLLRNLLSPIKPIDKTFEQLVAVLTKHFNPAPSEIVERLRFNSRVRQSNESVATFVSELRRMSEFCNYGNSLDHMLRDRIVCGIQDDAIQRKLLSEPELTLNKALTIAQAMEAAARNSMDMKSQYAASHEPVNKISESQNHKNWQKKGTRFKSHFRNGKTENRNTNEQKDKVIHKCIRCCSIEHTPARCPFIEAKCHKCGKIGHISKACLSDTFKRKTRVNHVDPDANIVGNEYDIFHLNDTANIYSQSAIKPYLMECTVNGKSLQMEVDTGSAFSLIPEHKFSELVANGQPLKPFDICLTSFSGHEVKVLGEASIPVNYKNKDYYMPILVFQGRGPILCGRSWIFSSMNILSVNTISQMPKTIDIILKKHDELFSPGLGLLKDVKVHLHVKPNAQPKFCKARPVPYALKQKVEDELMRLESLGIISSIPHSEYAAPIVAVLKKNGTVRICGDYKITANPAIDTEKYPLPTPEDIFSNLAGCKYFSRLDMSDAYNQLALDEESKKLVVVNTLKGLFQYNRLPFGVSSASAIFQRHIETVLKNTNGVSPFQDDVLVGGTSKQEHLERLDATLSIIKEAGLKLKSEKCEFVKESVEFLGFRLDSNGLHPLQNKLKAIECAPPPEDKTQLQSFLGLYNYYSKFVPDNSTRLAPLYKLLEKSVPFKWTTIENNAFLDAKNAIVNSQMLVHFDPSKEIHLACDASPYGIGAVLSHVDSKGNELPISFASRTLTKAEKNYPQIEREALSIVFGVTRFRNYLLGRKFFLITDHQPLVSLFSEKKSIPAMAAARIQRWALTLSAYNYCIIYKKGKLHANADAMSRLPMQLPTETSGPPLPVEYVCLLSSCESSSMKLEDIKKETELDPILGAVLNFIKHGWPDTIPSNLKLFWNRKMELSQVQDILIWGIRIVVPEKMRKNILAELHSTHQGIVQMKGLARSKFWWPGMDAEIEILVQQCKQCQQHARMPRKSYIQWPVVKKPWYRVHIDFAGPIEGKYLLIIVDSFTKWLEVDVTTSISTDTVISSLRQHFSRLGIPVVIVTDNAACFTSSNFQQFVESNGIKHICSAPYHPESNGLAERSVQTVKTGLKKISETLDTQEFKDMIYQRISKFKEGSLQTRLARLLLNYRRTPKASGFSPAELLFGRPIRTRLDLCDPRPLELQEIPSADAKKKAFEVNDLVFARNFGVGDKWYAGRISKLCGNMMFYVETPLGNVRRHVNQLRKRYADLTRPSVEDINIRSPATVAIVPTSTTSIQDRVKNGNFPPINGVLLADTDDDNNHPTSVVPTSLVEVPLRRSGRISKKPMRLNLK